MSEMREVAVEPGQPVEKEEASRAKPRRWA